ncbi:hypothetical protein [Algoriphagus litoralis]|uniref:hypothetical protein n=1 Tax=Algoriphagus litoralis TaxID=2202829 RepID=UPI000DB943B0|nr:hypothetical protein [Algoriphagus litoralis]
MRKILVVGFLVLISSCKSMRTGSGDNATAFSTYQEDLTPSLPQYPNFRETSTNENSSDTPSSVQSIDAELKNVQKKFAEKNKSEPYLSGYTVLVFSGIDRNAAFKTQDDLKLYFPDLEAEMQYQQPRYLVKLGQYTYKIEAQKVFSQIKEQFPTARIIQDRFQRKEYVAPSIDQNAPIQN